MDLVTLVTACALAVDPKLMHALVWHQSGGEPWAVSVQGEPSPRVYSSLDEAIRETRAEQFHCAASYVWVNRRAISRWRRSKYTIESRSIGPSAMPQRRDGSRSDRQARQSLQGASASQSRSDLLRGCGLSRLMGAAGSQIRDRHRDIGCQGMTRRISTCRRAPAPRFSTRRPIRPLDPNTPAVDATDASPERARGWSSALFPSKPKPATREPDNTSSDHPAAVQSPSPRMPAAPPPQSNPQDRELFVRRSSKERAQ